MNPPGTFVISLDFELAWGSAGGRAPADYVANFQGVRAAIDGMLELKRQDAENAEKSFFLRSHHAAWQMFIERYPEMKVRWKEFLNRDVLAAGNELPKLVDPEWPLTVTE